MAWCSGPSLGGDVGGAVLSAGARAAEPSLASLGRLVIAVEVSCVWACVRWKCPVSCVWATGAQHQAGISYVGVGGGGEPPPTHHACFHAPGSLRLCAVAQDDYESSDT
eukprot:334155-Chlamydomonas_euryale.AAC.2